MTGPGINFTELAREVGLDEVGNIEQQEVANYFMPAAVVGLADGDLVGLHPAVDNKRLEGLYGYLSFGEGNVAQKVLAAAIANAEAPGIVHDFQTFADEYFSDPRSPFDIASGPSSIRIYPDGLEIDGTPLVLTEPPQTVIEYGSCLMSRSLVGDQVNFLRRDKRPFAYVPVARTHFTNSVIMREYDRRLGAGAAAMMIDNHLYTGREDGVESATNEMVEMQTRYTGSCDIADVIVCAGIQHSTPEDIKAGINNAGRLIKQGGVLVVRSYAQPAADELGTEQIIDWAYDSGFPENGVQFSATYQSLGHTVQTGRQSREMKAVVLTR